MNKSKVTLSLPSGTKAVLWDMDGVIIDSLGFDEAVVGRLLSKYIGSSVKVSRHYLKSIFAYDPGMFWRLIIKKISRDFRVQIQTDQLKFLLGKYRTLRGKAAFGVCPGIPKTIAAFQQQGIKQVVVSNNPVKDVRKILANAGLAGQFNLLIGNDRKLLAKKPAPDCYLYAIKKLGLDPGECVVVEDSMIGVQAGKAAGCYTIAVATGSASLYQLSNMRPRADKIYSSLL